jgi:PAS domain S-box-containing protein
VHARVIGEGIEASHEADPYVMPDGRVEWVRWSIGPWRTDAGEVGGLVLYTELVSEQVAQRRKHESAEAQYRAVFDQAAMGVARVSPDGRFLEVNDRFCSITGYPREKLLDATFRDITHPDDMNESVGNADALLAGSIDTYSSEKRYMTSGGAPVWVLLTVSLVRDDTGQPVYFVTLIADITARKEAEAEQQRYQGQLRLMINELNHRVKNTLATVQSMAAQTLRGERDASAAYGKFEARLLGLSEVHEVLTRERWHGAALHEVAERALRPFAAGAAGRIEMRGPQTWLQPGAALTLALVFHELATNAVKYGALGAQAGHVELAWTVDEPQERFWLTWTETGGPPVASPTRKGFGSRLIERAMTGEFNGSVEMDFRADGLVCAMNGRLPPKGEIMSLIDGV